MELAQGAIEQEGMTHHQAIAAANRAKKSGHGHGTLKRGAKEGDQVEVEPPEYLSSLPTIEGKCCVICTSTGERLEETTANIFNYHNNF